LYLVITLSWHEFQVWQVNLIWRVNLIDSIFFSFFSLVFFFLLVFSLFFFFLINLFNYHIFITRPCNQTYIKCYWVWYCSQTHLNLSTFSPSPNDLPGFPPFPAYKPLLLKTSTSLLRPSHFPYPTPFPSPSARASPPLTSPDFPPQPQNRFASLPPDLFLHLLIPSALSTPSAITSPSLIGLVLL